MRNQPSLLVIALLLAALLPSPDAGAASAKQPGEFGGSYTGEVVVRSLSPTRVVVGLDEHGFGFADRLFFADTAQPVGPFSSRSSVSTVDYSAGRLVVEVPSEQRAFVFQVSSARPGAVRRGRDRRADGGEASARTEPDDSALQKIGFEVVRIDQVVQLAAYAGLRQRVSLAEVRNGSLEGVGPRSIGAAAGQIIPQNPTPPGPDDGSGCRSACSATCGGGSNCSITCTNGHCGACDCVAGHGASCTCNGVSMRRAHPEE